MEKNKLSFIWNHANDPEIDETFEGDPEIGPGRQLLSTFYTNLVRSNLLKLDRLFVNSVDYVVFKKNLTEQNCSVLGQLAFMSFRKYARFEYNFPETYYKIMLHKKDEKLEDYLSLADLKTMLSILHESKDGKTIYGNMQISINIEINPNKDDVLLKYAKEEVYKIYCRMHLEKERKTLEDLVENYENEISKLMFGEGVNIKDLLEGFLQDFYKRLVSTYEEGSSNNLTYIDYFKNNNILSEHLQEFFQGKRIDSIDDFMEHVEVLDEEHCDDDSEEEAKYLRVFKDKIKEILESNISKHFANNKKNIIKFFEQFSYVCTGSRILVGKIQFYVGKLEDQKDSRKKVNYYINCCSKYVAFKSAKKCDLSACFEKFLISEILSEQTKLSFNFK
jgi:hypothetical protein